MSLTRHLRKETDPGSRYVPFRFTEYKTMNIVQKASNPECSLRRHSFDSRQRRFEVLTAENMTCRMETEDINSKNLKEIL